MKGYNRLSQQKSPYLIQHSKNPVNWYPWGKEAFREAKRRDVPLFISIGYSTCHWCHVMAHESFENQEVADLLNRDFVAVKVDREERPDVDSAYMRGCQLATGSGGWPLTVIATPEGKPFFFSTYIPKESRYGRKGLLELLPAVSGMWKHNRDELLRSSENISREMDRTEIESVGDFDPALLDRTYSKLQEISDPEHGGFIPAPKFPMPHRIIYLLRYWYRTGNEKALRTAKKSLEQMRLGGIYDQLDGGFHRYSTDPTWRLPHFEKMLYDQAMQVLAYTEGYQASGDQLFADTVEEIVDYVIRELGDRKGGFHSSEDADTDGVEGKFYTWKADEILEILGRDRGMDFMESFNMDKKGNFSEEATGRRRGDNVLHPNGRSRLVEFSRELETLRSVRKKRKRPFKDDKILTDWNGLFIAALARAGWVFRRDDWIERAVGGMEFILNNMKGEDGVLLHRYRDGEAAVNGFLDDHSFTILAILELYRATGNASFLNNAMDLADTMIENYLDRERGGFYNKMEGADDLKYRSKEGYDGAKPSGNSAAAMVLLKLSRLTGREEYERYADGIYNAFSRDIERNPTSYTYLLSAMMHASGRSREIVLCGVEGEPGTEGLKTVIDSVYDPFQVLVIKDPAKDDLEDLIPYTRGAVPIDGNPTAYVCRDSNCDVPVMDPGILKSRLENVR